MSEAGQFSGGWNDEIFKNFAEMARKECGLTISPEKSLMVQSRIRPRVRKLGLDGFSQYYDFIQSEQGSKELDHLISALTTNVSYFFREPHHFERLEATLQENKRSKKEYKVWSAGSSNGQEAYSIAMKMHNILGPSATSQVKILATDIDRNVLKFGKSGRYSEEMINGVSQELRERYFTSGSTGGEKFFEARDELKDMISFKLLNLIDKWPMKGPFDAIFCRNVVIYFDDGIRRSLWPRFASLLRPESLLFIGHSERITNPEKYGFELIGPTAYKRIPNDSHHDVNAETRHGVA